MQRFWWKQILPFWLVFFFSMERKLCYDLWGALFQVVMNQASQDGAKLPTIFKLFNISQKEKTLQELIQDKWLCQTSSDQIGLGIRSFFDLRGWFRTNEVPSCDVCNETGVKVCT
jgi:non-structural maintenance of chromosomes element 1